MGVLHWTESEALSADLNSIIVARDAQWEFTLDVLEVGGFIKREPKPEVVIQKAGEGQSLSPTLFRALFSRKR